VSVKSADGFRVSVDLLDVRAQVKEGERGQDAHRSMRGVQRSVL
jgi:hypothetical protein